MTTTEPVADNGVNTQALLDARDALSEAPEAANFTWKATNEWVRGTRSDTAINGFFGLGADQNHKSSFSYTADHPEVFAAEDQGPTPVEFVLVALASCLTAGVAAVAQNRGIQLNRVTATIEGDLNILGILGGDPDVRNGFDGIRVNYDIDADASPEDIEALVAQSQKRSAVFDVITNPTNVAVSVNANLSGPAAERTAVVVIGAGHAGLAVSRLLSERGLDHVVLERGEVAHTWRTERWDSLRLLTPNWQTRLPGLAYDGDDPDGYMAVPELVSFIDRYARVIDAPVRTGTTVTSVTAGEEGGYRVETTAGTWEAAAVVVASGAFNRAHVPAVAADLPPSVQQVTPLGYRRPDDLGPGRVLVVGASATGVQIADELLRSGRDVTVAVGEHVRMPRTYRDRDIFWWMDRTGRLDERWDEVDDLVRARRVPSPQLVGTPERRDLDLNALTTRGARLVGRLSAARDGTALFSGSLRNVCNLADLKLVRLLDAVDEWAADGAGPRPSPTRVDDDPRLAIDLVAEGYDTVLWATGFRPDHSWLHVPVFDRKGDVRHHGGVVTDAPGLYRIGLTYLRRRKSSFIHGAEDDAHDLVDHLAAHLTTRGQRPTPGGGRSATALS